MLHVLIVHSFCCGVMFQFLNVLNIFISLLNYNCSNRFVVVSLICIFLMINEFEHLFMCVLVICMSSFKKHLFRSSVHFLLGLVFCYWVVTVNYILWIEVSYQTYEKIFSILLWIDFHFLDEVLWSTQVFNFMKSNLFSFFLCPLCFCPIQEHIAKFNIMRIQSCVF